LWMTDRLVTRITALPKPAIFNEAARAILRVAAYARVSTDHEDQETSLAAQADYYKKKITEHPGWEFVEIYVDDGISGLSTNRRDGFNRMMEDCLAGHIDLVLTKSISRFARNTVDTVTAIRKLKEKGVGVYFEKENIFTTDSKGEFLLTLMSSLAQEESRSISENVTWGQRKRMADGKVSIAYSNFLGYDKGEEKYTMVINEEQAVTVRRIFHLFLQGYTPHTIASLLTADRVPTPCGCDTWNQQTIRRMLSNEKYKGDALLQKEFTVDFLRKKKKKNEGELPQYYVEGDHEPIISPWLFDYVQKRLDSRFEIGNTRYSGVTLFSSKLICEKCGSIYGPKPWHSTSYNHLVWQCRRRHIKENKCLSFNIYDKLLHFAVHDIAMNEVCRRNIEQTVTAAVLPLLSEVRKKKALEWLRDFRLRDIWKLQSDEEDIAMIIDRIVVMENGTAEVHLIDGNVQKYTFPEFHPAKYKEESQKRQEPRKKASKKPAVKEQDAPPIITACQNCGAEIVQRPKVKQRRFCCNECRNQWWNQHLDEVKRKTYYEIICRHCGKVTTVYGDSRRKYCSHECYIQHRYTKKRDNRC
jgi:DNA invertase Pin-like site-specific DNA recombinase